MSFRKWNTTNILLLIINFRLIWKSNNSLKKPHWKCSRHLWSSHNLYSGQTLIEDPEKMWYWQIKDRVTYKWSRLSWSASSRRNWNHQCFPRGTQLQISCQTLPRKFKNRSITNKVNTFWSTDTPKISEIAIKARTSKYVLRSQPFQMAANQLVSPPPNHQPTQPSSSMPSSSRRRKAKADDNVQSE